MPLYAPAPIDLYVGPSNPNIGHVLTAFPTINAARLYAFTVNRFQTVSKIYFRVGTASGNMDVGVYDDNGTRLTSSGSTAVPTAAQTVSLTVPAINLSPGIKYWVAIACDNVTAAFGQPASASAAPLAPGSVVSVAYTSSFPLPASVSSPSTQTPVLSVYTLLLANS